eukprot:6686611-Prymnesium_polylepis.1
MTIGVHISISASGAPRAFCARCTYVYVPATAYEPLPVRGACGANVMSPGGGHAVCRDAPGEPQVGTATWPGTWDSHVPGV